MTSYTTEQLLEMRSNIDGAMRELREERAALLVRLQALDKTLWELSGTNTETIVRRALGSVQNGSIPARVLSALAQGPMSTGAIRQLFPLVKRDSFYVSMYRLKSSGKVRRLDDARWELVRSTEVK